LPHELRTERLLLRQWEASDLDALYAIYRQPEFLEHMPALDRSQTAAQIERFQQRWTEDGFSHWAAVDPTNGRLIGRIGLIRHRDWPLETGPVEVGWTLDRAYWGRGLATEGGAASVALWHDQLPDDARLLSITRPMNQRSRAVMERLGLSYRGKAQWHGSDVVWYAIDR
jgi:RimJ/RimL family protein N-acetyltransferase